MFGNLWSVYGGNRQVPELLLQHSSANILHPYLVTTVQKDESNKYIVESVKVNSEDKLVRSYDIVIVANPITSNSISPIKFLNFTEPVIVPGQYHRTVATIISGVLNGSYFGLPQNDYHKLIINNNVNDVINSIGEIESVFSEKNCTETVWKIFSQRPLRNVELDKLFQKRNKAEVIDWFAYPHYEKLNLFSKFILHDRLFYINAIEWAASAMEMSIIGAKNVALLVQNEILNGKHKSEPEISFRKIEL